MVSREEQAIANKITYLSRIARLLSKLSHSCLLRRLALVNQAGRELDAEGFDGRAVLHDDHGADGFARVLEDRHDGDGVNAGGLAGFARGGFPDALLAVLEMICEFGCGIWNGSRDWYEHGWGCVPGRTTVFG